MNNLNVKKGPGVPYNMQRPVPNARPAFNNRPMLNGMAKNDKVYDKFNKATEMFSSSPYAVRAGIIILGVILILIIVYLVIVYYSYQVSVQALIPDSRVIDISKMMDAESYVVVNNSDNNFSLGFWLFTNGIDNIDSKPLTLLRCTSGYAPETAITYNENLTVEKYKQYKNNVIDSAMFTPDTLYDTEKIIVGLYGNDLFIMLKPVSLQSSNDEYIYLTIDFLPLSSWNHVSITVDGEFIILYLNGEIYKTQSIKSLETYSASTSVTRTLSRLNVDFNQIVLMPNINKTYTDPSNLANTYITKLYFSDDLVSQKQVEQLYAATPYGSSFMSKIGYGLRSPVYRLDYDSSGAV
jgi:hypothetical protein